MISSIYGSIEFVKNSKQTRVFCSTFEHTIFVIYVFTHSFTVNSIPTPLTIITLNHGTGTLVLKLEKKKKKCKRAKLKIFFLFGRPIRVGTMSTTKCTAGMHDYQIFDEYTNGAEMKFRQFIVKSKILSASIRDYDVRQPVLVLTPVAMSLYRMFIA